MGLTVSEKSVFLTSFDRGRFQRNLFPFEKRKLCHRRFYMTSCLEIRHNGVTFFLSLVDKN